MKPEQAEAAASRGHHRATRRSGLVVALAVLVLLAAGCGRQQQAAPQRHRLQGSYIVHGFFPHRTYGMPCKGADAGYPDIRPGTAVRVKDGTGKLLGTVALEGGTLRKGKLLGRDDDCVFSFGLTVPEQDSYRIEVGRRGVVQFPRSALERSSWKADLTIGAYTMFGGI